MRKWMCAMLCFVCLTLISANYAAPAAYACSRGPTSHEEDFLEAQAIFTAKVTKVQAIYPSQFTASVEAIDTYKGEAPAFVVTNDDGDQCGAGIEEGQTYLFYSRGVERPYVSVFDTHRFADDRTEKLLQWLNNRTKDPGPKAPGVETVTAYLKGQIRVLFEHHDRGRPAGAFITDNSVYVPLSFFSDNLWYTADWDPDAKLVTIGRTNRMEFEEAAPDGETQANKANPYDIDIRYDGIRVDVKDQAGKPEALDHAPEPFLIGLDVYVPLRAVAEKLGYEVEWGGGSSVVVLHLPFEEKIGTRLLGMRYKINFGLEGAQEVERLTKEEITYRTFNGHIPEGSKPVTVPFGEMLRQESGIRQYAAEFYVKTDKKDILLLASHEFIKKLESDAAFREKVGAKLGKPLADVRPGQVLHTDDFE
ncbi:hypothetical protein [Paenibacillus sp. MBLB4367]|uniref:hypothetical protein n=1 Tax=Paenibacillus sp. MBLB4367 TaxID=3384767 RepID=UPI003907FAD1